MRVAILADIHGNAAALRAVLQDAKKRRVDAFWVLGDVFGYGPSATACLNLLEDQKVQIWLMGNHDWVVFQLLGGANVDDASLCAMMPGLDERKVAFWHARQLEASLPPARWENLKRAPFWVEVEGQPGIYLAHGAVLEWDPYSPRNVQGKNSYIGIGDSCGGDVTLDRLSALYQEGKVASPARLVIVGHGHIPLWMEASRSASPRTFQYLYYRQCPLKPILLNKEKEQPVIISPGSVGQPRDRDPRAAYAILDWERRKVWFRRVAYDVEETIAAMVPQPSGINWQGGCERLKQGW